MWASESERAAAGSVKGCRDGLEVTRAPLIAAAARLVLSAGVVVCSSALEVCRQGGVGPGGLLVAVPLLWGFLAMVGVV